MSDNKHGECCGCPAIMADGRLFTQWQPRRLFHERLLKNVSGESETQRYMLQQKPELVDIDAKSDDKLVCRPGANFYVDSSDYHQKLFNLQKEQLAVPNQVNGFVLRDLFPIDGSYKL